MEMVGESQDEKHWGMHCPSLERGRCQPLSASGFPPLVTVKITCIIGTYVRVLFLSVLRTLTFNVNFRQLAVNASQCRVPEARERKWSLILRAKARCGMQAFHLGQSMKRTSMYAL